MNDSPLSARSVGADVAELDELRRELARARGEIQSLNAELAETNQGVIVLYAELDEQARQLREATDLKSRFLSYMSHEFRVPLGAIRSISRMLLDRADGPLLDEQAKQVQFIQGSAEELSEMVDDLLDLARIEAGRVNISPGWFELVDLFSALRGMFKPILINPEVSLNFEEPVDMPRLYSDNQKLSQILRNFISNALKFTARGEVSVAVRRSGPDRVVFSVSDTGIGIAPEHLKSLFQEFVQVKTPQQSRLKGVGLGLALSKKFAELLGGRVSAESEPGVGSTFSVEIPLQLSESSAETPEANERPGMVREVK